VTNYLDGLAAVSDTTPTDLEIDEESDRSRVVVAFVEELFAARPSIRADEMPAARTGPSLHHAVALSVTRAGKSEVHVDARRRAGKRDAVARRPQERRCRRGY
jgi:hypothetical protein